MKISEKKLRKIIRQVILEAKDPNDPEYFSVKIFEPSQFIIKSFFFFNNK